MGRATIYEQAALSLIGQGAVRRRHDADDLEFRTHPENAGLVTRPEVAAFFERGWVFYAPPGDDGMCKLRLTDSGRRALDGPAAPRYPNRQGTAGALGASLPAADVLRAALEEAYAHKSALRGLYEGLRQAGHAHASHAAYEASEAAYRLVVQLHKDLDAGEPNTREET